MIQLTRGGATLNRDHPALAPEAAVPEDMQERMHANLPPVIRRTAAERYRELVKMLYQDMSQFYRDGQVYLPASLAQEMGDPSIVERLDNLRRSKGAMPDQMRFLDPKERKRRMDSVLREIKVLGTAKGRPDLDKQITDLAQRFIVRTANKQREANQRFVTTPGHGHLNA